MATRPFSTHRRLGALRAHRSQTLGALAAVLAIGSTGGIALAATGTTLATGKATVKGQTTTVVVDPRGFTLYTLSGESTKNLKCTSKSCLTSWPPYKVSAATKLTKAKGVEGRIGKLHRSSGNFYQVTLNGKPLYFFFGDHKQGAANGEDLMSAGGTWHVVTS